MPADYDAIIVGTGQAGPPLAARLTQAGLKTAIIERKLIGGTCVNVGCIPTKTLVGSARAAHVARRAGAFGVVIGGPDLAATWLSSHFLEGNSHRGFYGRVRRAS